MSTTTESATSEATIKEGVEIKGKDVIKLTAPEILPPAGQLLTNAQDIVGAINELFQEGTGANGAFRAVLDNNAGQLKIVVQENDGYYDYVFGYDYVNFTKEIKLEQVVGDEIVKSTRTFSKRIVTSVYDSDGAVLLVTEYNAESGVITRYYDGTETDIHIQEWREEYTEKETQSEGAKSAAVAWVLARNKEQSSSLELQMESFRKGLVDGGNGAVEKYNTTDEFVIDVDNRTCTGPAATDMADGWKIFLGDSSTGEVKWTVQVHFVSQNWYDNEGYLVWDAQIALTCTSTDGKTVTEISPTEHPWEKQYDAYGNVTRTEELYQLKLEGRSLKCFYKVWDKTQGSWIQGTSITLPLDLIGNDYIGAQNY